MRPRATTLKCDSQTGELLEITYKNLMNSVKLVETSCIFLDRFIKLREEARKKLVESSKKRHCVAERIDIKTSVNAMNRFGKLNKIYFEEKAPTPKAYASKVNINDVKTQRPLSSLMNYYNSLTRHKLPNTKDKKINSNIFRYTEMQATYFNCGTSRVRSEEKSADDPSSIAKGRFNYPKRMSLIINKDKIVLHKSSKLNNGS